MKSLYNKIIALSFFIILPIVSYTVWITFKSYNLLNKPCVFCKQEVIDRQKVYETNFCMVLCDFNPVEPHHMIIIPKRHTERLEELTNNEIQDTFNVIKTINNALEQKINKRAYLILQKNGGEVGQTIPHAHFHYISISQTNNHTPSMGLLWSFIRRIFQKKMSLNEITKEVNFLRTTIIEYLNNPTIA